MFLFFSKKSHPLKPPFIFLARMRSTSAPAKIWKYTQSIDLSFMSGLLFSYSLNALWISCSRSPFSNAYAMRSLANPALLRINSTYENAISAQPVKYAGRRTKPCGVDSINLRYCEVSIENTTAKKSHPGFRTVTLSVDRDAYLETKRRLFGCGIDVSDLVTWFLRCWVLKPVEETKQNDRSHA